VSRSKLLHGDCRDQLATIADNSIDAIVTDPPYELGFMGKSWDASGIAYDPTVWTECLRVLKPGGHLLAFSGSRTYHRMAVAIEDAGFQIRDQIMWVYGSGFPKSMNIAKAIDKASGFDGAVIGKATSWNRPNSEDGHRTRMNTSPGEYDIKELSPEAEVWEGWGTALKPAHEPIVLARKPLVGTVAENVLRFGVGGLNIDGCRVATDEKFVDLPNRAWVNADGLSYAESNHNHRDGSNAVAVEKLNNLGRWPANLIHDGSDEALELFPETAGGARPAKANKPTGQHYEGGWGTIAEGERINFPAGSAARFFYCAKASKKDRNEGLDHLTPQRESDRTSDNLPGGDNPRNRTNTPRLNHHPTVKPTELMRYLCRLITPPNGVILDPFTGSGSTGKAAILEHFQFIGIEQDPDYITIAQARIQHAEQETQP
jgi:site-specific DNA-methyltransferase (adenine-specific)